ncbi:KAP family NTPase [Shewanella submarina]|uniref:P-loop NTPase fold protein n=1 Tax=Shewanella submarina TaxID=2016376 RepID=A0ABV7GJM1_9GAMM|nr:P-loop NTPase fold protein [Shewanella submarina]MCL1038046.1 KAP family NTPase [Shewanella submarina]
MLISLPKLEIDNSQGFKQSDIFGHSSFGNSLINLVLASEELVIALDAEWGEGKTTFTKLLIAENNLTPKLKIIYFDAFENDYQKDPFIALTSEFYQAIPDSDSQFAKKFLTQATKASMGLMRGAAKIGINQLTLGLINTDEVISDVEKEFSKLASEQVDEAIKNKIVKAKEDKMSFRAFTKALETLASKSEGERILFIIDELDRCRPDFALEILEKIKHIFFCKGVTFLLVTNRAQLEQCIKSRYGQIDAQKYLDKFVNIWLNLPKKPHSNDYYSHGEGSSLTYLRYCLDKQSNDEDVTNGQFVQHIKTILSVRKVTHREVERLVSRFALVSNSLGGLNEYAQIMLALYCYHKIANPELLKSIMSDDGKNIELLKEIMFSDNEVLREPELSTYNAVLQHNYEQDSQTRKEIEGEHLKHMNRSTLLRNTECFSYFENLMN